MDGCWQLIRALKLWWNASSAFFVLVDPPHGDTALSTSSEGGSRRSPPAPTPIRIHVDSK